MQKKTIEYKGKTYNLMVDKGVFLMDDGELNRMFAIDDGIGFKNIPRDCWFDLNKFKKLVEQRIEAFLEKGKSAVILDFLDSWDGKIESNELYQN